MNFPILTELYGLKYNYHYHRSGKESSSILHVQKNDKKCEKCRQSPSYHAVECKGFPPILTKSVDGQRGWECGVEIAAQHWHPAEHGDAEEVELRLVLIFYRQLLQACFTIDKWNEAIEKKTLIV